MALTSQPIGMWDTTYNNPPTLTPLVSNNVTGATLLAIVIGGSNVTTIIFNIPAGTCVPGKTYNLMFVYQAQAATVQLMYYPFISNSSNVNISQDYVSPSFPNNIYINSNNTSTKTTHFIVFTCPDASNPVSFRWMLRPSNNYQNTTNFSPGIGNIYLFTQNSTT